jgi:dephospho-CoA kinase
MLKAGLTGNIGSGKSLIADIFKVLGIPVFDADSEAKAVLHSAEVSDALCRLFGGQIFQDGSIDHKALASIVFSDEQKLGRLNALIHPRVRQRFDQWFSLQTDSPYIIYEAAIMIETGFYKQLDKMIVVMADKELRISRVMKRDSITRQMVEQRMARQWDQQRKAAVADYIITNNHNDRLIRQVLELHHKIILK